MASRRGRKQASKQADKQTKQERKQTKKQMNRQADKQCCGLRNARGQDQHKTAPTQPGTSLRQFQGKTNKQASKQTSPRWLRLLHRKGHLLDEPPDTQINKQTNKKEAN